MAQISEQHVPMLTSAFVGVLALSIIMLGVLNYLADR